MLGPTKRSELESHAKFNVDLELCVGFLNEEMFEIRKAFVQHCTNNTFTIGYYYYNTYTTFILFFILV